MADAEERERNKDMDDVKRGRNSQRGGKNRTRIRKKSGPKQSTQELKRMYPDLQGALPMIQSGGYVSTLLSTVAQDVKVLEVVERNCYLVNVQALVSVFHDCEIFVRALTRQGGWRRDWYYTGLWMRRLCARLQRVSNASGQFISDPSQLLDLRGDTPLLVSFLINQFGIVEDHNTKCVMYPLVTENLIKLLAHYGSLLMQSNLHPNLAELQDAANYASYIQHCYGLDLQENLYLARHFSKINTPFTVSLDANIRRQNIASSVNHHRRSNGNAVLSGPQWANIGQDGLGNPLLAISEAGLGANVLLPIPGITAPILAQFNNNAGDYVAPIDLLVNFPLPANLAAARIHPNPMTVEVEDMEFMARFVCGHTSASPEGSWSPLVTAHDVNSNVSGTIGVKGVSVGEYLIGVMVNQYVTSVTRDMLPYNWATLNRQRSKYSIPPLGYSRQELLAKMMRECLVRRKG